jgi:hypothetical protein
MLDARNAIAYEDKSFLDLFYDALETCEMGEELLDYMDPNCCYTFELVSPFNRVVVPYKKTEIYLIGCRSLITMEELEPPLTRIAAEGYVKTPKTYPLNSLKACFAAVEHMGYDEEGFVVVDKHWNRVKIKSPAYVIAHHMSNNKVVSRERILEVIERGEESEFLGYFPEYKEEFDRVNSEKEEFMSWLRYGVEIAESLKHDVTDRKTCAEIFNSRFKDISSFLFKFLDTDLLDMFIQTQWNKLTPEQKLKYLGL